MRNAAASISASDNGRAMRKLDKVGMIRLRSSGMQALASLVAGGDRDCAGAHRFAGGAQAPMGATAARMAGQRWQPSR